jgi:hypothetical protein
VFLVGGYIFHISAIFLLLIQIEPDRARGSVGLLLLIDAMKNYAAQSCAGRGRDAATIRFQICNVLAQGGFPALPLAVDLEKRQQPPLSQVINAPLSPTRKLGNRCNAVE